MNFEEYRSFCWATDTCLGLLVKSAVGFIAWLTPCLCVFAPVEIVRFNSCVTPAWCLPNGVYQLVFTGWCLLDGVQYLSTQFTTHWPLNGIY